MTTTADAAAAAAVMVATTATATISICIYVYADHDDDRNDDDDDDDRPTDQSTSREDIAAVAKKVDVLFLSEIGHFGSRSSNECVLRKLGAALEDENDMPHGYTLVGGYGAFAVLHKDGVRLEDMHLRPVFPAATPWQHEKTVWRRHLAVRLSTPSSHAGEPSSHAGERDQYQVVCVHTVSGHHKTDQVDHTRVKKSSQWDLFKQRAVQSAVRDAELLGNEHGAVPLVPSSFSSAVLAV